MKWLSEYKIAMENTTILSIRDNDSELLVQKSTQKPIIPGNTLAGGLRSILGFYYNQNQINSLFGQLNDDAGTGKSRITISDAIGETFQSESRTQVKINSAIGTIEVKQSRGQLTSQMYLVPNIIFNWQAKIEADSLEMLNIMESMFYHGLNMINNNLLKLGSKKTSGAGAFKIIGVTTRRIDLSNPIELFPYLKNETQFEKVELENHVSLELMRHDVFNVELISLSPLLIGGNSYYDPSKPDRMNIKNGVGRYIIPGSSLKGVFRQHCTKIAKYFDCEYLIKEMFGSDNSKEPVAGRLFFNDVNLECVEDTIIRNRIHIDRFTSGVKEGALVEELPIIAKCELTIIMNALVNEKDNEKAIGLLLLVLKDISDGSLSLGSGYSIGRGRFSGKRILHNKNIALDFENNSNAYAMQFVRTLKG